MTTEHQVVEVLRNLPPEKQQEVLDFAQFLASRVAASTSRPAAKGRFAHLGVSLSAEDIDTARQELWGDFPRKDLP